MTGGASGIGAGLVQAFAAAGAKVAFADIQDEQGDKAAEADRCASLSYRPIFAAMPTSTRS